MNKVRRKRIEECYNSITEQLEALRGIMEEEQEAYDNLPESIQNGAKGDDMQECIDKMDQAISDIESGTQSLEDFI